MVDYPKLEPENMPWWRENLYWILIFASMGFSFASFIIAPLSLVGFGVAALALIAFTLDAEFFMSPTEYYADNALLDWLESNPLPEPYHPYALIGKEDAAWQLGKYLIDYTPTRGEFHSLWYNNDGWHGGIIHSTARLSPFARRRGNKIKAYLEASLAQNRKAA